LNEPIEDLFNRWDIPTRPEKGERINGTLSRVVSAPWRARSRQLRNHPIQGAVSKVLFWVCSRMT
jgi:hypothetical protein